MSSSDGKTTPRGTRSEEERTLIEFVFRQESIERDDPEGRDITKRPVDTC